jgi:hypothetical protein
VDWTKAFLASFVITGHCGKAAEAARTSYVAVWRRRKSDPVFAEAYQEALAVGAELLEAEAVRRATEGVRRMKFNSKTGLPFIDPKTGEPYIEHEYSDVLMMALLRRHFPDKYGSKDQLDVNHSGNVQHAHRAIVVNFPNIMATPRIPLPSKLPSIDESKL